MQKNSRMLTLLLHGRKVIAMNDTDQHPACIKPNILEFALRVLWSYGNGPLVSKGQVHLTPRSNYFRVTEELVQNIA